MIIRPKGNKWLRIDIKANTVEEYNTRREAELGVEDEPEIEAYLAEEEWDESAD